MKSVAIVGAGLSGLTIAKELQALAKVTVFEKSRSVGGRMSTRRAEPYIFDHGAQYFTIKHPAFEAFLQEPLAQGVVQAWPGPHVKLSCSADGVTTELAETPHTRYVAVPGMSGLAKYVARDVDVVTMTRVTAMHHANDNQWTLLDEAKNSLGVFDWVVVTTPSVQACALMPESFSCVRRIAQRSMLPCFAFMLGFDSPVDLQFASAQVVGADISWLAHNESKPGRFQQNPAQDQVNRGGVTSIVVHAAHAWSALNIDHPERDIKAHLASQLEQWIGLDCSKATYSSLHRWRFAKSAHPDETDELFVDYDGRLAVAGDWCWGARVESAYLSGLMTARAIAQTLST